MMKDIDKALLFIKSKHNGEIPYRYGSRECAKLMTDFAEKMMHDLVDRYEEKIQSKVPELRKLIN